MNTNNLRHFYYGVEDDRFIVEYQMGDIYVLTDKQTGEEFILDNIDSDTTPTDILQM
jgi:hypothetical protein